MPRTFFNVNLWLVHLLRGHTRKGVIGTMLKCTAKGCCCGMPVVIKTIGGRKLPLHVRA